MLRYSDETIYGALATRPEIYLSDPENATSPEEYMKDTRTLLVDLRNRAAAGDSLRKVAAGSFIGPDNQTVYALVQCTPELYPLDCSGCLFDATAEIPLHCGRKRGCRILRPSCSLHFEAFPFYNETRLQEFEPVSLPVPVPAPEPVVEKPLQKLPGNHILYLL